MERKYAKINPEFISAIQKIVGDANVFSANEVLQSYSHDETEDLRFVPELVVKPRHASEISEILLLCNALRIPVTPRGAGTGLSGAALPVYGGLVLSMERFNRIMAIDERN